MSIMLLCTFMEDLCSIFLFLVVVSMENSSFGTANPIVIITTDSFYKMIHTRKRKHFFYCKLCVLFCFCWAISSGDYEMRVLGGLSCNSVGVCCKCQKCSTPPAFEESLQLAVVRYLKKEYVYRHHFLVQVTRLILSKHNISQKQAAVSLSLKTELHEEKKNQ